MTTGVYAIEHLASGRCYIGSSNNIRSRWSHHRSCLNNGTHINKHLQNAWRRYGADAFAWRILIETPRDECLVVEARVMSTYAPALLYNYQRPQADELPFVPTPEIRARMSAALQGRQFSDESKRRMSESKRGTVISAVHREQISAAFRGRPKSEEHRRKIGEANRRRTQTAETRAKLRTVKLGGRASPEARERMRAAQLGKKRGLTSDAVRAKISAAQRERWQRRKAEAR